MKMKIRDGYLSFERCHVMGILNVTPDSFSDGGKFDEVETAVARAREMVAEGATIIDIGGESTRPGATPVGEVEELKRVLPVIERLANEVEVCISIDTQKASVAKAALAAGAHVVNDINGGRDAGMFEAVKDADAGIIIMHMQGTPETMANQTQYANVVDEVNAFLAERIEAALAIGLDKEALAVDPGIGFGKTPQQNLQMIKHLDAFGCHGLPVLLGASRKSFIGKTLGYEVDERLGGSLASAVWGQMRGMQMIRVHDVKETVQAIRLSEAIQSAE